MIREFEEKVKYAVSLVKLLSPPEKLEAVTIWNNFSAQFQSVIDSTVGKNPPVGFGKCFQRTKPVGTNESLDLSLANERSGQMFLPVPTFVPQANETSLLTSQDRHYAMPSPVSCDRLNLDDLVASSDLCSGAGFSAVDNLDSWEDLLAPPSSVCDERERTEPPRPSVITDNRLSDTRPSAEKKAYACSVCQTSFSSKEQLNEHLSCHASEKPFACMKCNAKYRQLSSLKRHLASHEGVKNFECPTCKRRFAEKKTMMTHQRTHTGEKPFLCGKCGVSFAQQATLSNHELLAHKGAKRYKCQLCPSSFFTKAKYEGHMNKHEDTREFECEHCPKAFFSKDDRNRHQKTHVQPKRHKCDKCNQLFRREHYLKQHLVNCLKEPADLTCLYCTKVFTSSAQHSRHIKLCALKNVPVPLPQEANCLFSSSQGEYVVP